MPALTDARLAELIGKTRSTDDPWWVNLRNDEVHALATAARAAKEMAEELARARKANEQLVTIGQSQFDELARAKGERDGRAQEAHDRAGDVVHLLNEVDFLRNTLDAWSKASWFAGISALKDSNDPIEALLYRTRAALAEKGGKL